MRVTHVITRLIVGGAQENTISTVIGLANRAEFHVELLSGPALGPEGSLEPGLAARPGVLKILPDLVRPVHPWRDARAYHALRRHFANTRPDVVHTHSGKAGVLGRLAAARAGVPLVVHTIHGPSFGAFQGSLANAVFRGAERRAAHVTDHFVVVAEAMKQQYLAAGIGKPSDYTTIYSGFQLAPFLSAQNDPGVRARFGFTPEDIVIGKIARLFTLKGHDTLFQIAPELTRQNPRIKFLLVGDGAWRERFETMARQPGLASRVAFAGLVPPDRVPELVGIMDVLIHLSTREGLPRALPQAMAAGKPVVSWDCDGAGEVCLNGKTGFLIRPGDLGTLNSAIQTLAKDANIRARLGAAGRFLVSEKFDVDKMVNEIAELYFRLSSRDRLRVVPKSA
jgi:glycosyltransferase involved in cell wall biosynthesis